MRPPIASLFLATMALTLSLAFVVGTLRCGVMTSEESMPGEPPAPSVCETRVHPLSIALTIGSLVALVALFLGKPEVALVVGLVGALVGIPLVFSGGLWSIPVGLSLAVAGALQMRRARPRVISN